VKKEVTDVLNGVSLGSTAYVREHGLFRLSETSPEMEASDADEPAAEESDSEVEEAKMTMRSVPSMISFLQWKNMEFSTLLHNVSKMFNLNFSDFENQFCVEKWSKIGVVF
jgi:hypothetical protein